ncbi:MAG: hypothetical protein VCB43_04830 [Myxococcota bacterium]
MGPSCRDPAELFIEERSAARENSPLSIQSREEYGGLKEAKDHERIEASSQAE